ncbi:MAG TPA: prolyl oligopeptidase family serine peptidase [Candidatus Binatia bacterium]|jgi:predicted peptidase|nr:prolyl oligopeptidase family serine peptidase [Candidatus Binatia bacterium]
MRQILSTGAAALFTLTACTSTKAAVTSNQPPMQMAKTFKLQKTQHLDVNYLLFLPKDYEAKSAKRWPLLLFLHGIGERGTDVWKVATHGPPKYVAEHPDFPFIVVSPQCPDGQLWSNDTLLALLDDIMSHYAVDTRRVYLTGLSMGGYGAWSLGLAHPEKFAAIVPICGGGDLITLFVSSHDKPDALKALAVWAFHGAKDPVVPVQESQRMVELLKKFGVSEVKLTVYPEAQHDCWTETYKNPEVYDWLLQHERK